jgi:hypothetical protein
MVGTLQYISGEVMKFYRYRDSIAEAMLGGYELYFDLEELVLLKETSKGYWICDEWALKFHKDEKDNTMLPSYIEKRWVSKTSVKRYAYPTKKEAWVAFKARKRRQHKILKAQFNQVNTVCEHVKDMDEPPVDRKAHRFSVGLFGGLNG